MMWLRVFEADTELNHSVPASSRESTEGNVMRHRIKGRKLNRNGSHRKAMFRNMAASMIKTLDQDDDADNRPKVAGRIITTVPKAKELRPRIEKLITMARKAVVIEADAEQYNTSADRGTDEWKAWRNSDQWQQWAQAVAPAIALRRRAFAELRDHDAVNILFDELAERFADRQGGYTRIVRLASPRLGDAGQQALIEFVGENDRVKSTRKASSLSVRDEPDDAEAEEAGGDVVADESTGGTVEAEASGDTSEASDSSSAPASDADEQS